MRNTHELKPCPELLIASKSQGVQWARACLGFCRVRGGLMRGAPLGAAPPPRPVVMAELAAQKQPVTGIFACFVFEPAACWN